MNFDHGILNVPLSKRGDIDKQIDAYKDQVKQAEKARASAHRADKARAKALLAEIVVTPGLVEAKAAKLKQPTKLLLATLDDWAKWQPAKLIALHAQWIAVGVQP